MINKVIKFSIFLVLFTIGDTFASSWPSFRFNQQRTASKYEVAIPSSTPFGWTLQIQGKVVASPIVKEDKVYLTSRDNSVWVLDAYTGEILWQYSTSGLIDASAVVWRENLYVLSYDGNLYCFTKSTTTSTDLYELKWSYNTNTKSAGSPVIVEDEEVVGEGNNPWIIFVSGPNQDGTTYGKLYIFDAITGDLINAINLDSFSYSSLSYLDGKIYFTTNNGMLQCYDLKQNKFLWQQKFLSSFYFNCVTIKDNFIFVYAGDIERRVYMLDKDTGEILWSSKQLSNIATDNTSLSVFGDKIFVNIYPTSLWEQSGVVYSSQTVVCISTSTGLIWRKDFFVGRSPKDSYGLTSAVSVVGNVAFFGTYNGDFLALDINNGNIISKYSFNSPILCSAAVANGLLYFAELNEKFYAVELDKFMSIKTPDIEDVIINFATITILSKGYENKKYSLEYFDFSLNQWIKISTGIFSNTEIYYNWDTKTLLDGRYTIKLYNEDNEYAINEFTIDNSPLPPLFLTALKLENNKIMLSWTKSFDDGAGNNDVKRYNIYISTDAKNFRFLTYVLKNTTFYIDTQLPAATYYYKISAVDKNSESYTPFYVKVYLPVISKPATPVNFKISSYKLFISSALVEFSWNNSIDESTNVATYNLYYSTDNINFVLKDKILKTSSTIYYYHLYLVSSLTHYFYLTSENYYGVESEKTDAIPFFVFSVTKPSLPRNLTGFDTPNDTGGNITLIWLYSLDEENAISKVVAYNIYKSSDNINFWKIYYFYNINKTTYSFIDTNCPIGVTFYYFITSVNEHGLESDPSQVVSVYSVSDSTSQPDTTAPRPPKNLTVLDYPYDEGTKLLLSWQLSEDDGSGLDDVVLYKIYRSTDNITYTNIVNLTKSTTFYIDTQLTLNTTYYYYITAQDKSQNESLPSNYATAIPVADGIAKPPSALISNLKNTYDKVVVMLNWNKSQDDNINSDKVLYYIIYKSSVSKLENFYVLSQLPKNTTFYEDLDVEPDSIYYYYISCLSKYGYESKSTETIKVETKYETYLKEEELPVMLRYKKQSNIVELYIQKGSLKDQTLTISMSQQYPQLPQGVKNLAVYSISPSYIKFNLPVRLRIYYNNANIAGINQNKFRIYYYDSISSSWRMLNTSVINSEQKYVEAYIYNGGFYTIAEYLSGENLIFKDEHVYTFPSPAKGDEVYFKFILYQPARVRVYVYDILGNLIWQSEEKNYTDLDIGKTHLIKWDIRKIATGMYIFKLEGKNENVKKIITKKFAIIH